MQLLRVEDFGNCKTSVERICQVRVGWECCRYLLNVRLPTLVLGLQLLTRFTGDIKNNNVIKHILPLGMLVSWYPDTHIYHLNESVKWQVRWNKIALAVVLETVCGAWLLAEKFKKWKSNPFLNGGDIERQSTSELSFSSSVNQRQLVFIFFEFWKEELSWIFLLAKLGQISTGSQKIVVFFWM